MRSSNNIITSNQITVKPLEWEIVYNKSLTAPHMMYSLIWHVHTALVHQNHESSTVGVLNCS